MRKGKEHLGSKVVSVKKEARASKKINLQAIELFCFGLSLIGVLLGYVNTMILITAESTQPL